MTPKKEKYLSVLLVVLICLIAVVAVAVYRIPKGQVRFYDTTPKYDESVSRLGVTASKFAGMGIYVDSPAVLLNKADKLGLTDDQKERLQGIANKAREEARAILSEDQMEKISPIPTEPVVLDKLDRIYTTCEQCELPVTSFEDGHPADHEH